LIVVGGMPNIVVDNFTTTSPLHAPPGRQLVSILMISSGGKPGAGEVVMGNEVDGGATAGLRAQVAAELHLDPADTRLATDRYTSPVFLRRELDDLWYRTWQVVGREEELPEAGSFRAYAIGDRSYLVVRQDDGSIRAFANVCLHRGNVLCEGAGRVGSLRCPYHAWTWRLDGSLARIPDRHLFDPLADDDYALPRVGCGTWGGFVFLVPEPERAPSLEDHLGALPDALAPYRLEGYVPSGIDVELPVACNWKTFQDAFMETYHLPFLHSQMLHHANELGTRFAVLGDHSLMITPFGEASERARGVTESGVLDAYLRQLPVVSSKLVAGGEGPDDLRRRHTGPGGAVALPEGTTARSVIAGYLRRATELAGFDTSAFTDDQVTDVWQYSIFPNTLVSCHPGHVLASWVVPHPTDPDRCTARFVNLRWTADPASARPERRVLADEDVDADELANLGLAIEQDLTSLPRQQRGLRSGLLREQTLSRHETRLAHLHRTIDEHLAR
jgi:phenylpropionate dioxygenase-like ring-hydroxylating dioxygenase large terminal subunit